MGQALTQPTIAVIIVAYQKAADIERVLLSLQESDHTTFNLKIFIVDNSTDGQAKQDIAAVCKKHATYVDAKGNGGFAEGNNIGMSLAAAEGADFFFLLNADTAVEPDCLAILLASQQKYQADIIAPRMLYPDGMVYYAGGFISRWLGAAFHTGRTLPPRPQTAHQVSFINGAGMFLPVTTYTKWGGLPELYFMYYEETDWCATITADGGQLWYEPRAQLTHFTEYDTAKSPSSLYYLTRNQWIFARRQTKWYHRLVNSLTIRFFQGIRVWQFRHQPAQRAAMNHAFEDVRSNRTGYVKQ